MKIILLGAGLVGKPMAFDLARKKNFDVCLVDHDPQKLENINNQQGIETAILDCSSIKDLQNQIQPFDLVINALPGHLGYRTLEEVINSGKDIVDISFFPEDPKPLEKIAIENNVTAIMDCGVAPGMSYILVGYVDFLMDQTTRVEIFVGGLPKIRKKPFEYKAVFSPSDVIEEYTRPARFVKDGKPVTKEALSDIELMDFPGIGTLEAFNSDGLRSLIKNIPCPDMIEKTLRYPGHAKLMKVFRDTGFFDKGNVVVNGSDVSPLAFTSRMLFPEWQLGEGDEDLTIMKVVVEGKKDQKAMRFTYDLLDYYDKTKKVHSMARTTGYTATVAARMILDKTFTEKGLIYPEMIGKHPECVSYMLDGLEKRGVVYHETIEEL